MMNELDRTASLVLRDEVDFTLRNKQKTLIYFFIKNTFDFIFAYIGCLFLLPISIILKIAFMLSGDFHSIFYTQNRIGKDGKIFKLYKFRSMVVDADERLEALLKKDKKLAQEYKINKKLANDPRITKVGKFIRKTSIDELPQLVNILFGDMSFVGNRPYLPKEKKDMGSYYKDIILTRPGLTGFWQCSLRSRGTFKERLKMEKFYSQNQGLKFDISILVRTFKMIFNFDDAK